jgi:hypothetical protein
MGVGRETTPALASGGGERERAQRGCGMRASDAGSLEPHSFAHGE